jgi:hypothetical protein
LPDTKLIIATLPISIGMNHLGLLQFYGTYCFILSAVLFYFFLWVTYNIFV